MKQTYHSNSTTNLRLRSEINKSNLSYRYLSLQYGVSENIIGKWKNRVEFEDKSSRPHTIKYALSDMEMLIAIKLRVLTWWSLDEITEAINSLEPEKIRSAVYRTFVREGINKVPEKDLPAGRQGKKKQRNLKNMTLVSFILMLLIYLK